MNFKSKLFGTLAAATFTLSMMGGVASAEDSDSISLTANVEYRACSVVITSADIDFGNWQWNGTKYELQGYTTPNYGAIEANVVSGSPKGCTVTVSFEGLRMAGAAEETVTPDIAPQHFRGSLFGVAFQGGGGNGGLRHTDTYTGSMQLRSVPNTAVESPYVGTVHVGVVDAS